MKAFWKISQFICVALWALFAYLAAAKKKPAALFILLGLHTAEYFTVGRAAGAAAGVSKVRTLISTLLLGFTWWVPVKKGLM